jgi:outer membrane receptor protein involved in Fe transport
LFTHAVAVTAEPAQNALEEVVVTGTHIRGAPPVGSRVITLDREEIRKSGATRLEEVLRSLPQVFSGGPREEPLTQQGDRDRATSTNISKSATVDLRGLGAGTTLVLLNGRRLPGSGSSNLFTDISNLPLAALERIEVLTDGASALYGSDAVGGVVNVVLKQGYSGIETSVRNVFGQGDVHDYHVAQTLGTGWGSGSLNVSYEYVKRDQLRATSRPFSANSDKRPMGGDDFSLMFANPGTIMVGDQTYAIPRDQDGRNLDPASLVAGTMNLTNTAKFIALLPEQKRHNAALFFSQELGSRVTLRSNVIASWRDSSGSVNWLDAFTVPSTNPFYVNPTGGTEDVTVFYDLTRDLGEVSSVSAADTYGADVGLEVDLGRSWRLSADIGQGEVDEFGRSFNVDRDAIDVALRDTNPVTALNVFGDGPNTNPATIDTIRSSFTTAGGSKLRSARLLMEGPVAEWTGGQIRLAVGTDYRDEQFATENFGEVSGGDRDVRAAFTELRVPLVGPLNRLPGLEELALAAALRHERYSDFGTSTVPKYGLSWKPLAALRLRASWSESFRAPDLQSLNEGGNTFRLRPAMADPLSPTGQSNVLFRSGGNAGLKPETAQHRTAGFDIDVPLVPNLRLSATYFDIRYNDRLRGAVAGVPRSEILGNPVYDPFVIRNPDAMLIAQVCNSGGVPESRRQSCRAQATDVIIDERIANTAVMNTNGIDFDIGYRRDTSIGALGFGVNGTYIRTYELANAAALPPVSQLNLTYAPVDTRLRGRTSWDRGAWSATAFLNYVDDYRDENDGRKIDAWTTVDLDVAYSTGKGAGLLSGVMVSLNVKNMLGKDPPFVNTELGYDVTNADPYGRVVSLLVTKAW